MRIAGRAALALWVALVAVFMLGPLVWLALRAFVTSWHYPSWTPDGWTLRWWSFVFSGNDLSSSVGLSFTFAPIVTLVSAAICLPAAYAFARFSFPGRRFLLVSLFATNAFPKIGLYVALAGLFYGLNLMTTFAGVVIVQLLGTIVFMTWIPSAAFAAVPRSLEEAARDAGAGPLGVFAKVTLPLALPGIATAMIMSFLAAFDEAQGTYLVGAPTYVTMPTKMYELVNNYPEQAAAVFAILLAVPSTVLMLLVRKHVMGGRLAAGFQLR
ncbi:ABC transporter permease [Amycolatopsis alkalitolerans]|uniref:ABC transporter permease subunit n=1 Tax=Amycolatopsis alkalitolerans TaxID=2547244 RepID=A0A5C4M6U9_9PSEU|nr:ABC transporter permease subunit [Amycolatopsis alkalitolerans]TNC28160.1 ABC transporter permease subunit [Amycolatopsis alkalitolerans]